MIFLMCVMSCTNGNSDIIFLFSPYFIKTAYFTIWTIFRRTFFSFRFFFIHFDSAYGAIEQTYDLSRLTWEHIGLNFWTNISKSHFFPFAPTFNLHIWTYESETREKKKSIWWMKYSRDMTSNTYATYIWTFEHCLMDIAIAIAISSL